MRQCFLLRGLPGSGKTTWAEKKAAEVQSVKGLTLILGPDVWGPPSDGYPATYTRFKAEPAERQCLKDFCSAVMEDKWDAIFVDKFNTQTWEYSSYLRVAEAFGYEITVVEFLVPLQVCLGRMTKRVFRNEVRKMYEAWDETPQCYTHYAVRGDNPGPVPALPPEASV